MEIRTIATAVVIASTALVVGACDFNSEPLTTNLVAGTPVAAASPNYNLDNSNGVMYNGLIFSQPECQVAPTPNVGGDTQVQHVPGASVQCLKALVGSKFELHGRIAQISVSPNGQMHLSLGRTGISDHLIVMCQRSLADCKSLQEGDNVYVTTKLVTDQMKRASDKPTQVVQSISVQ